MKKSIENGSGIRMGKLGKGLSYMWILLVQVIWDGYVGKGQLVVLEKGFFF